jgi:hypothetical protein
MLPGRPFGNEDFVSEMAERFGRYWTRGRPKKKQALARPAQQQTDHFTLFLNMLHQAKIAQFRLTPFFGRVKQIAGTCGSPSPVVSPV